MITQVNPSRGSGLRDWQVVKRQQLSVKTEELRIWDPNTTQFLLFRPAPILRVTHIQLREARILAVHQQPSILHPNPLSTLVLDHMMFQPIALLLLSHCFLHKHGLALRLRKVGIIIREDICKPFLGYNQPSGLHADVNQSPNDIYTNPRSQHVFML